MQGQGTVSIFLERVYKPPTKILKRDELLVSEITKDALKQHYGDLWKPMGNLKGATGVSFVTGRLCQTGNH